MAVVEVTEKKGPNGDRKSAVATIDDGSQRKKKEE